MPSLASLPEAERRTLAKYMASLKVKDWYLESTRAAEYEKLTGKEYSASACGKVTPERLYRGARRGHSGDRLQSFLPIGSSGVQIEAFTGGIGYFSPFWVVDLFLVPFLAGMVVSLIYGFGGKWLSYIPSLIVRCISYFGILDHLIPHGAGILADAHGVVGFLRHSGHRGRGRRRRHRRGRDQADLRPVHAGEARRAGPADSTVGLAHGSWVISPGRRCRAKERQHRRRLLSMTLPDLPGAGADRQHDSRRHAGQAAPGRHAPLGDLRSDGGVRPTFAPPARTSCCTRSTRPGGRPAPATTVVEAQRLLSREQWEDLDRMVPIPAGAFIMGTDLERADEQDKPQHRSRCRPFTWTNTS